MTAHASQAKAHRCHMPRQKFEDRPSRPAPRVGAPAASAAGPSADLCCTGNSNPDLGLFGGTAKGVK